MIEETNEKETKQKKREIKKVRFNENTYTDKNKKKTWVVEDVQQIEKERGEKRKLLNGEQKTLLTIVDVSVGLFARWAARISEKRKGGNVT